MLYAAALSLSTPPAASAQLINFYQEEILIRVYGDSCAVTGTYHFRNQTDQKIAHELFYPFPVTPQLPEPVSVEVTDVPAHRSLPWTKVAGGIVFLTTFAPQAEGTYEVRYIQLTPCGVMEYILTSTGNWGIPLKRATYTIVSPGKYSLIDCSIAPDTSWRSRGETISVARRSDFMPDCNLRFRWDQGEQ
jgi:hypothetical protein